MRSLAFNLLFYVWTFLIALTVWVLAKIASRNAMWHVLRVWARGVLWFIRVVLGSRVEVRGLHHLKGTPQLVVAKHQSELDIVMLGALMWDISAVAMQELERYPFFGGILKGLDLVTVAVDRGRQGRTQQAVEGALRMKAEGRTMVIYPEGELMKLGARERYRRGAAHIYEAMGVEAVPVAASLGVIWPQRRWEKHARVTGCIEFLEPIPPGMDKDAFMAEVERRIEEATMRLIREHASGPVLAEAERLYAAGFNNHEQVPHPGPAGELPAEERSLTQ